MTRRDYKVSSLPRELCGLFGSGCSHEECPLWGKSRPVRSRGSWRAKVLWIGEGAGKYEERENCTFIGPAGQEAADTLSEIGLPIDKNFLLTNVCLCRPRALPNSGRENRSPSKTEIKACRPNLERIVEVHKPKLMVLVGGTAAQAVLGTERKVSTLVGQFFSGSKHTLPTKSPAYVIWHPSYILRNMGLKETWEREQLYRLRDYMAGAGLIRAIA